MRWTEAEGQLSEHALASQYEHIAMNARSLEPNSGENARMLLASEEKLYAQVYRPSVALQVARFAGKGAVELANSNPNQALKDYQAASGLAVKDPDLPLNYKLTIQQRLCVTELKAGQPEQSEACSRQLIKTMHEKLGLHANTNMPEIALTQALLLQGKYRETIAETTRIYPAVAASLGSENAQTLQVLSTRAVAEGTLQQWDASISDDLAVAREAHKSSPHGLMAIGPLADAATSECREGRISAGEAHARQALADADFPGVSPALPSGVRFTLASTRCSVNRAKWLRPDLYLNLSSDVFGRFRLAIRLRIIRHCRHLEPLVIAANHGPYRDISHRISQHSTARDFSCLVRCQFPDQSKTQVYR